MNCIIKLLSFPSYSFLSVVKIFDKLIADTNMKQCFGGKSIDTIASARLILSRWLIFMKLKHHKQRAKMKEGHIWSCKKTTIVGKNNFVFHKFWCTAFNDMRMLVEAYCCFKDIRQTSKIKTKKFEWDRDTI